MRVPVWGFPETGMLMSTNYIKKILLELVSAFIQSVKNLVELVFTFIQ